MNSLFVDNTVFITRLKAGHIGRLVQALFEEWHGFEPWSSVDKIHAYYGRCLRDDELPLAFAAVDDSGILLGSATVKRHDMESFPQYEYWLGDVFVLPEYRGKGIGRRLVVHCIGAARSLGIKFLYLYTPDVQIFYESFGWAVVGRHFHNGEWVTVMRLDMDKV